MKKIINLRKIVSVIISAVISCMCLLSPVSAVENNEPVVHTIGNYGVVRLEVYPAVVDYVTGHGDLYTPYAYTTTYSGGAGSSLVNLTVNPIVKSAYRENNCNAWVFFLNYAADRYTRSVRYEITLGWGGEVVEGTIRTSSNGTIDVIIPSDITYVSYNLYTTFTDGTIFRSSGHVNI